MPDPGYRLRRLHLLEGDQTLIVPPVAEAALAPVKRRIYAPRRSIFEPPTHAERQRDRLLRRIIGAPIGAGHGTACWPTIELLTMADEAVLDKAEVEDGIRFALMQREDGRGRAAEADAILAWARRQIDEKHRMEGHAWLT